MKKAVSVTVDGLEIRISYLIILIMLFCFAGGIVLEVFLGTGEIFSSQVFSPFSFTNPEGSFLKVIVANFVTYGTFVIIGMLLSASAFGFLVIPPLVFLLGFSVAGTGSFMMDTGLYFRYFLLCLPLWSVFIAACVLYYSLCFYSSFSFMRANQSQAESDKEYSLSHNVRVFYFVACFSTALAVITSLLEYILCRVIS